MVKKLENTIKAIGNIVKKEKFIFLTIAIAFFSFFVAIFIVNKVADLITERGVNNKTEPIQQALTTELEYVLRQSKEMVESQIFDQYIERGDVLNILSIQNDEKEKRGLELIVAVNEEGIALSRIPTINNRGDYVAQTTPWGRSAAEGIPLATIGVGRDFPLIIVGAYPIKKNGDVVGAIYSGLWFNDEYSLKFKEKYLKNKNQIAFYSREEGITGSSFEDESVKNLLYVYFNQGTKWILGGYSNELVRINNDEYFVKNVVFPDGGVLIFVPYNSFQQNIIISLITVLIFLLPSLFLLRKPPTETQKEKRLALTVIAVIGLCIFISSFCFNQARFKKEIISIEKPPYTIYNSTLKFEPEQNVIDLHAEQRITIKIDTGGEAINAVQIIVNYDPSMGRIENVLTNSSFCSPEFFLEKEIDNNKGEARIVCGLPNPGFIGEKGVVAELLIQPLKAGELVLRFGEETQVLANDGLGTNVLRMVTNANYRVTSFESKVAASDKVSLPEVIIFSSTHPNSERWYNKKEITFSWPSQEGYSYIYLLDQTPDTTLTQENGKITNDKSVVLRVETDGAYYFHIAAKKEDKIGPISHFKIKIDKTPPLQLTIKSSATKIKVGEVVRFEFSSKDEVSGLQSGYYVKVDNGIRLPSLPQLYVAFSEKGKHTLSVRVFDNANNFSDADVEINVE